MRWRVYYSDGTTVDDTQSDVWSLQAHDVQLIKVECDTTGSGIYCRKDYYCWDSGKWDGVDQQGMWYYLFIRPPGPKKVLAGRSIDNADFDAIYQRAKTEPL